MLKALKANRQLRSAIEEEGFTLDEAMNGFEVQEDFPTIEDAQAEEDYTRFMGRKR